MGYTIVIELWESKTDETTRIYYGCFPTFGECSRAMEEVKAEPWPEDEDMNRLVEVGWRALRDFNVNNMKAEVTRFINKGRRKS